MNGKRARELRRTGRKVKLRRAKATHKSTWVPVGEYGQYTSILSKVDE